eukprot:1158216-Pelagomonas_calceolata.AAC.7
MGKRPNNLLRPNLLPSIFCNLPYVQKHAGKSACKFQTQANLLGYLRLKHAVGQSLDDRQEETESSSPRKQVSCPLAVKPHKAYTSSQCGKIHIPFLAPKS